MAYQNRKAEDANYWETTVHPGKSQGEIVEMLEEFGAEAVMFAQGQAAGTFAWLVRFQWRGRAYHFTFRPLECRWPNKEASFDRKRRSHTEQARYQMGRIAVHFVKAVLTAAEANPDALFGFVELPGVGSRGGVPYTAAEVDVEGLTAALPPMMGGQDLLTSGEE